MQRLAVHFVSLERNTDMRRRIPTVQYCPQRDNGASINVGLETCEAGLKTTNMLSRMATHLSLA